jgi:putative oxidoreductase
MRIVKTIISALFGLFMIVMGLNKFLNFIPMPKMSPEMMKIMEAFMMLKWLMPLVGAAEVVGGLLFIFPKTRALGAIVILPVMVGIMLHNMTFMPSGLLLPGIFFLINIWMISDNWKKYTPMVS